MKDTLAGGSAQGRAARRRSRLGRPTQSHAPRRARPEEAAQRSFSEVLFYPPEAVARGPEGECACC
ncbi:MAG: hypothetical protein IPO57_13660 [Rhodocyclales bacterium]|nr:hypothetical protein [Rhodocyclales bacterium]